MSELQDSSVLLVDDEILVRRALVAYLEECGFAVIEVALTDDALKVLTEAAEGLAAVLVKWDAVGALSGPDLARWVQSERPEIAVFVAGDVDSRAHAAGAICEERPVPRQG